MDGIAIAKAYENLKHSPNDANVIEAYKAFRNEIRTQFDSLPIEVEFVDSDPYTSSKEMFNDIEQNNKLKIFSEGRASRING